MFDSTITFPEQLLRSDRTHDRFVRLGLEERLEDHHKNRMPLRYRRDARQKFGFSSRKLNYLSQKLRKQRRLGIDGSLAGIDHIFTGESMREVLGNGKIVISGSASSGTLRGRLVMRLPHGGGTGRTLGDDDIARLERALLTETRPKELALIKKKLANRDNDRGKTGVTTAEQVKELRRVTSEEVRETSEALARDYVARIKRDLKRPRLIQGARL